MTMQKRGTMRAFLISLLLLLPVGATAQGQFSPVITVNDAAITGFEIEQRRMLLELFRTPGNLDELALEQLIDDRLKAQELDRQGLRLTDEGRLQALGGRDSEERWGRRWDGKWRLV